MMRQFSHAVTTPARTYSLSPTSPCQRNIASARRLRLRCRSEFMRFSSRTLMRPSTPMDRVRIVGSPLLAGSSASSFICNAENYFKLYFDGASRGNPGPSGAGAYLVNSAGKIIGKGYKWLGNCTNTEAEFEGLILGLEAVREAGITILRVYGDSQAVIKQMHYKAKVKSSVLKPCYNRAQELISDIPPPRFRYKAREENSLADKLANQAIDNQGDYWEWFD